MCERLQPAKFAASLRKFPRSLPWGFLLMGLGTAWFLWNLSQESISDFASYKGVLFALFAAVGIGSCVYVHDFLAVRGLAVVSLLLGKLMVDAGRPRLDTHWVLLFQGWAYLLVIAGIWLTVSPWRFRDLIAWHTVNEARIKMGCAFRLVFGLLIAVLGWTKF